MAQMNPMQQQQRHPVPNPGPGGPQQQSPPGQQPGQQQPPQPQDDKLISKARELVSGPLKEKWAEALREASQRLYHNGLLDAGNSNAGPAAAVAQQNKFESNLEDFHAICDQIEQNLRCAIECQGQASSAGRYMIIPPQPSRPEMPPPPPGQPQAQQEYLSYTQYIATSKQQVQFTNDMRQILNQAAKDVVSRSYHPSTRINKKCANV